MIAEFAARLKEAFERPRRNIFDPDIHDVFESESYDAFLDEVRKSGPMFNEEQ